MRDKDARIGFREGTEKNHKELQDRYNIGDLRFCRIRTLVKLMHSQSSLLAPSEVNHNRVKLRIDYKVEFKSFHKLN